MTDRATPATTGSTTGTTAVEVRDLRTVFHTGRADVCAVDGVSLAVAPGETIGIVGESGSGKSVLGRTLMGLVTDGPTTSVTGEIIIGGVDLRSLSKRQRRRLWGPEIAMVFQDPMTSLNPVRTIGAQLAEPLRLHLGLSRSQTRERSVELLRQVGIPEPERRLRQYPHELSGGMRQRVVIAGALSCDPRVLVADEPTTALDVTVQKQILDLLADSAQRRQMATILISHDLGAVFGRTDRVAVMYAGRIGELAATKEIFGAPRHPYSAALLGSIPDLRDAPHTQLRTIEGHPPDMSAPPAGCRFAPRCAYATDECRTTMPELIGASGEPGRLLACHHPLGGRVDDAAHRSAESIVIAEGGGH